MINLQERLTVERHLRVVIGRAVMLDRLDPSLLDAAELKRAYYRRAKELHPDRAAGLGLDAEVLTERFRELQNSWETLAELQAAGRLGAMLRTARQGQSSSPDRGAFSGWGPKSPSSAAPGETPRSNPGNRAPRIPSIRLRLAEWLYYCGTITFETLVDALVWQYAERPRVGSIAVSLDLMDEGSVAAVMSLRRRGEPFCDAAVRLGYLEPYGRSVILGRQRLMNRPIGSYFVEEGFLSPQGLEESLRNLWAHNLRVRSRAAV